MGILKRLLGVKNDSAARAPVRPRRSASGEHVNVVGMEYYGKPPLRRGPVEFRLKREPRNKHDQNAIAVCIGDRKIGYLPRQEAARYAIDFDEDQTPIVTALGQIHGAYSATVYLAPPRHRWPITPPVPPRRQVPWGRLSASVELDDERDFGEAIKDALAACGHPVTYEGVEVADQPAVIVLDPRGVQVVYVHGFPVGRVPAETARAYQAPLNQLAARGEALEVRARLWARFDGRVFARVTARLPEPDEVWPPGPLPTGRHVVLPAGKTIQVTGEENHLNELAALLGGSQSAPIVATLHELHRPRGKPLVQVRCYGDVVGQLSPAMSEHMLPIVQLCAEEGIAVACRGRVTGNQIKADVALDAARSGDLSDRWIASRIYGQSGDGFDAL